MNLYNVILSSTKPLVGTMNDVKNFKVPKLQWLNQKIPCRILTPDGEVEGVCEKGCLDLKVGDLIQFERYGFVRLDSRGERELVFTWTHK
jgi:glutamyl-tRNA synthetase